MRRYLFGPVPPAFRDQNLRAAVARGECLTFNVEGTANLAIGPDDTWAQVQTRFPADWQPDYLVLHLPYSSISTCLWTAPLPLVGWATDGPWLWHSFRHVLPHLDLVLTDKATAEKGKRLGWEHVRAVMTCGIEQAFVEETGEQPKRDIDLLVVGNFHPAVQRERLPWLGRLARLGEKWKVAFHTGVFGSGYRQILRRAKLVFNTTLLGRLSRRVLEASACGAVVLEAATHADLLPAFQNGQHWVLYNDSNVEERITHYLTHDEERERIAVAAREVAKQFTFVRCWDDAVRVIDDAWEGLQARCATRTANHTNIAPVHVWQEVYSTARAPIPTAEDEPLLAALSHSKPAGNTAMATALTAWQRVVQATPNHLLARLNVTELLAVLGKKEEAVAHARQTLALLEQEAQPEPLDGVRVPFGFDAFRVEWERAGWDHAGDPVGETSAQRQLLRWRLHALLAQLTGDIVHGFAAVTARPDLALTHAALGHHLVRLGQHLAALPHLRQAVQSNPLDRASAFALFQALGVTGCRREQETLAAQRRVLARAAPQLVPLESWFQEQAGTDDLVSLVILCCNELEYTKLCLASIRQHTRAPYELILVDNGSTDGTPAFLDSLRGQPGPERVEVIHNPTNRGFPAGCNQGAALARGTYLLFLNNDTLVTPGWLDGLLAAMPADTPKIGLVGAVSNYAPAPQNVTVDYTDRDGLLAFADKYHAQHLGQRLAVPKLSGFCLLVKREAWQQTGGFDERYGLGLFDDDDLCRKARQAGWQLVVAQDVFVHHFGSRTFRGLGVDSGKLLQHNLEQFKDKWGEEALAGYQIVALTPSPLQLSAAAKGGARVSLTMIVKNEEANLPRCLASVADLAPEIIVVDTGSQDRTKEIAHQFKAKVFDFPWIDHFGAARNEALRYATGSWVFWLDGDDALDEENRTKLRRLFAQLGDEKDAYAMKVRSGLDEQRRVVRLLDQVRLFPRHPQIRWDYRIHEQILPAVKRQAGNVRWADIIIDHHGYVDAAVRRKKLDRNLRLLRLDDAERPNDAFTLFNLGWTLLDLGETREALLRLQRSLGLTTPDSSIVRKLYVLLALAHKQQKQFDQALACFHTGRQKCSDDWELPFEEAVLRKERGDLTGAVRCLTELLAIPPGQFFASVDPTIRTVKAPQLLAELCRRQNQFADAQHWCRQGLAAQRNSIPLWLELAEIALAQQDFALVEEAALGLTDHAQVPMEATILRARGYRARKDYAPARQLLNEVLTQEPSALGPRLLLSHVLLEEDRDPVAAEKVLTDLLERFPHHPDAEHNLKVLRARRSEASVCM